MTNIQQIIDRLTIVLEHSAHGSLTYVVGNQVGLKRVLSLLSKHLGDARQFMLDVTSTAQDIWTTLENASREVEKPIVFVFGFDELQPATRLDLLRYLNFHRERLRELELNLVLFMGEGSESDFQQFASDLSSIRSGIFYIPEQGGSFPVEAGLVRVLNHRGDPAGVGFLVDQETVMTCAHIIISALGMEQNQAKMPEETVALDFPFIQFANVYGRVVVWDVPSDIAVLKLSGILPPDRQAVELIARSDLSSRRFRAFGFPPEYQQGGIWASGVVTGPLANGWLQLEDAATTGFFIQAGFSGGPVWDEDLRGVIGMVVAVTKVEESPSSRTIGFCIPIELLRSAYDSLSKTIPEEIDFLRQRYLQDLIQTYDHWSSLYVPLSLQLMDADKDTEGQISEPIESIIEDHSCIMILGEPGSGKSTILQHLALKYAIPAVERLPILVRARDLVPFISANQTSFLDVLKNYFDEQDKQSKYSSLFMWAISSAETLLMIDGMDELLTSDRESLSQQIDAFAYRMTDRNRIIITSRNQAYPSSTFSGWAKYELLGFTDLSIRDFLNRFLNEKDSLKVFQLITSNSTLKELATSPYMLFMMVQIYVARGELPIRRVEFLDIMINSRSFSLDKNEKTIYRTSFGRSDSISILSSIAFDLKKTSQRFLTTDSLKNQLSKFKDNKGLTDWNPDSFLKEHSDVVTMDSQGNLMFRHKALEDYLAARHLVSIADNDFDQAVDIIRDHYEDDIWQETIILAVGIWGVLRQEPRVAGRIVSDILAIETKGHNDNKVNVLLAGNSLVEAGQNGIGQTMARQVQEKLIDFVGDLQNTFARRREASDILRRTDSIDQFVKQLVSIPRGSYLNGKSHKQKFLEKEFLIGKYPVTNLQYGQFIASDGYSNRTFWDPKGWEWLKNGSILQPRHWKDPRFNKPLSPAVGISWYEATAYCRWLSKKEGRVVRLPSEGEWLLTASGRDGLIYPWGNHLALDHMNNSDYWAKIESREAHPSTTDVFQFRKGVSQHGVFDLCGNVWEMTSLNNKGLVILCGGSWQDDARNISVNARNTIEPTGSETNIGFRVLYTDK